jgi:hypothetical protein
MVVLPLCAFFLVLSIVICTVMLTCKRRKLQESVATEGRDVFSVWNFDGRLAFEDIIKKKGRPSARGSHSEQLKILTTSTSLEKEDMAMSTKHNSKMDNWLL